MTSGLTQDDVSDILQIFGQSNFARLELALGPVRIAVNRAQPTGLAAADRDIVAPRLGRFQAAPEPGAPPFVRVGTKVQPGTTIGIIRVMEKATAVPAGLCGTVLELAVREGDFVEYGQTLVRVKAEPAAPAAHEPNLTNAP